MNFFNQGIPLGRWFGITVVIHWLFVIYAAYVLMRSSNPAMDGLYIGLLFATVLTHEFGHALSCQAVGGQSLHIVLWPLGGIAFVQPPPKAWAWLVTTVCGPLVNAILWPVFWYLSTYVITDAMYFGQQGALMMYVSHACFMMWTINRGLLLFNLIPAYPMDGGRLLQEALWIAVGYKNSLMYAGMVGVAAGAAFVGLGLGIIPPVEIPFVHYQLGGDYLLAVIGFLCATQSWAIYQQSRTIESWRKR